MVRSTSEVAAAWADLLAVLDLTPEWAAPTGLRLTGRSTAHSLPFVFGGQLAAQSLAAAYGSVVSAARATALRTVFLRPGAPERRLAYEVRMLADGASTWVRSVEARQGEVLVAHTVASFGLDRPGVAHQASPPVSLGVDPESLPRLEQWLEPHRSALPVWWTGPMAFDLRYLREPPHVLTEAVARAGQELWTRANGEVPAVGWLHDCLLAYATDLTLLDAVMLANGRSWYDGTLRGASLDHAVWFHRPARVDGWLHHVQTSPASYGARGLALGEVWSQDGALLASLAQQGAGRDVDR